MNGLKISRKNQAGFTEGEGRPRKFDVDPEKLGVDLT